MTRDEPTDADEAFAHFLDGVERGDAPDVDALAAEHPAAADDLRALAEGLARFGGLLGLVPAARLSTVTVTALGPGDDGPAARGGAGQFTYEILGRLGEGGMGEVFLAQQDGTAHQVALKRVRADALGAGAAERFLGEVRLLSKLNHPHVVGIYHVGVGADGHPYFTMPYVPGGTLAQRLHEYRGDFPAAARLLAQVARGVHHAHTMAVIHRDLKPANILIDAGGRPMVADFGLAEAGGGTPPWMAPEALRQDEVQTTKVDVWALGVILYELLTGRRPFPGASRREVLKAVRAGPPPAPRAVDPAVPADLEAVCLKCLRADPDDRYESPTAVALDLDRWLADEPVRVRVPGVRERAARFVRKHRPATAAAVGLGALILAAFVTVNLFIRDQDRRLRDAVCENNEYSATQVATAFGDQVARFKGAVERAAGDPALAEACRRGDAPRLTEYLRGLAAAGGGPAGPGFASVFVLDQQGALRAVWPEQEQVVGRNFAHRDYFHGALARAARGGGGRVHVSRVYSSVNDHLDKFAASVAFYPFGPDGPVWVLAAAVPAHDTLGLSGLHNSRHKVALLAPRENSGPAPDGASDRYLILVHPAYERPQESVAFPDGRLRRVVSPAGEVSFLADDDYHDPVAATHPEYAGRWLAGYAPVADTGLVVLAQQRYEDAVAPHVSLLYAYVIYPAGGVTLVLVVGAAAVLVAARPRRPGGRAAAPRARPEDFSGAPPGDGV